MSKIKKITSNLIETYVIIGSAILFLIVFSGCNSVESDFKKKVSGEFSKQPLLQEELLSEQDIAHLPLPVRKYITYTGAIGKPKTQNFRIEFDAQMIKKPGASPMEATSVQYNFFGNLTRVFYMKASMFLVPFRALHVYSEKIATFVVRVASLFNAVDVSGEDLTKAETVTLLNDMCVFAPGSLYLKCLSWKPVDSLSAEVTLENGKYNVSAVLYFNEKGELINFISNDRYALQDDGSLKKEKWSTPLKNYKEFSCRKVSTYGEAIWHYPQGDFIYGTFNLKDIKYNVNKFMK